MNLEINIVEAAAELAEDRVKRHFNNNESLIYRFNEINDETIYSDNAQELFELHYDFIFDKLIDCKSIKDDKSKDKRG